MARLSREAIETYMNLTGSSEPVAVLKLSEHGGNLNEAVDAYFDQGERNHEHETLFASPQDDFMEIDHPRGVEFRRPLSSPFPPASALFHLFARRIFDSGTSFISREPFVSHPRQVREIPIEVKDGNGQSDPSGLAPKIEDVTETSHEQGPEIRGIVMMGDEDEDAQTAHTSFAAGGRERIGSVLDNNSHYTRVRPSAPGLVEPDVADDIEEEMVRAVIEASKQDAEMVFPTDSMPQQRQFHSQDPDLAEAVSLSLKTAEQEKVLRELGENIGPSGPRTSKLVKEELGTLATSDGRLGTGSLSVVNDPEDLEEQPLVRHRSRHASSGSVNNARGIGVDSNPPSSSQEQQTINHLGQSDSDFPYHEWSDILVKEHEIAFLLEAALDRILEGGLYPLPYAPHHFMQNELDRTMEHYSPHASRPSSPSLTSQRLIREQQDDEYIASLQADRERELKEQADREAAAIEERRKEEELRRKLDEEQETERQLAAKEASLPPEPPLDDDNAVTLLVRMPDGSRRGRRFLKTDRLQFLFDFIDIGRMVKPGTYRLVRSYPRCAFSSEESDLALSELGLSSKQEALFLELI